MVKNTHRNKGNSLVAFCDNSSVIQGYTIDNYYFDNDNKFNIQKKHTNSVFDRRNS